MEKVSIPIETLFRGPYSRIREPLKIVIRNQAQWRSLWRRHSASDGTPPGLEIDFDAEMVAGIYLGQKSTGGYEVEITRAEKDGATLYLYYRERHPPPDAMVIQAITQPYHLVRLPKDEADPVFSRESP